MITNLLAKPVISCLDIKRRYQKEKEAYMELEEMLLVKERNREGKETSYLLSLEDYLDKVSKQGSGSVQKMAETIKKLYETKTDQGGWAETSLQDSRIIARFCASESELQGFLLGMYQQTGQETIPYVFEEKLCSRECFGVLQTYGMDTNGHTLFGSLHYEALEHEFKQGEMIHNFNGRDYRVLSVLSPQNLLLMGVADGQFITGIGVQMYERYPKEPGEFVTGRVVAVEWQHGIYLGGDIANIDCDILKQEYGMTDQRTVSPGNREAVRDDFNKHKNIADNRNLSEKVREVARESLWNRYGTEDRKDFREMLQNERYDKMLPYGERKAEKAERNR